MGRDLAFATSGGTLACRDRLRTPFSLYASVVAFVGAGFSGRKGESNLGRFRPLTGRGAPPTSFGELVARSEGCDSRSRSKDEVLRGGFEDLSFSFSTCRLVLAWRRCWSLWAGLLRQDPLARRSLWSLALWARIAAALASGLRFPDGSALAGC